MTTSLAIIPGVTGGWELLLILALVLLLFGPKRLPEIADAMGKSIRKFKSATRGATDEVKRELDDVAREVRADDAPEDKPKESDAK
ncbi:MAG: twin-arginine translocase TatA/TatE family subunit [bacterium]|nr:twin-arginine translocase TatA/TatE family subunit [bacterium]